MVGSVESVVSRGLLVPVGAEEVVGGGEVQGGGAKEETFQAADVGR